MRRMAAIDPSFLGFAHFGPNYDVAAALEEAERKLWEWVRFVEGLADLDDDVASDRLRERTLDRYRKEGRPEEEIATYDRATFWPMQARGIRHWMAGR